MGFNVSSRTADNYRLIRSHPLIAALDAGTYVLFHVPHKAFVYPLIAIVTTGTDLPDLEVGFQGNKETANTDAMMTAEKLASSTTGSKISNVAKYFSAARGSITVTLPTAITTGSIMFFAQYTVIH